MNKKILLLSNAYFPSIGGIENSLRHLAQEAVKQKHKVKIIVSDIAIEENSPTRFYDVVDGIEVERYPLRPNNRKPLSIFNLFYSNFILYRKLRSSYNEDPDTIVIARFHFSALIAGLAGFKDVKYIVPSVYENQMSVEMQIGVFNKIKSYTRLLVNNMVQKYALLRSNNYVFSNTMREQCIELAKNNENEYVLTKPGVDLNRFSPINTVDKNKLKISLDLPEEKPIILFVGRFVQAKGAALLLQALSKLKTDCHLVMVGEGQEKNNYLALISTLKIEDKVSIFPPTREVELYYQASDVFAMTSNYEPLGQTILEAFASGLPLVAFKKSKTVNTATEELGMDDFISYANSHSAVDLASAIDERLKLNETLDRMLISNKAKESFSWKELYGCLVKI
ncbi:glycosyltransferase family 4 protein [Shewanella frigidimarina]|uniref:glycosyltransferase family 4 protein n=1 Tax=Shewanella frigidimarina TaxID=56812 RepID=UPI003D7BAD50